MGTPEFTLIIMIQELFMKVVEAHEAADKASYSRQVIPTVDPSDLRKELFKYSYAQ